MMDAQETFYLISIVVSYTTPVSPSKGLLHFPMSCKCKFIAQNILGYNSEIHKSLVVTLDFKPMKQNVCGSVLKVPSGFWGKAYFSIKRGRSTTY